MINFNISAGTVTPVNIPICGLVALVAIVMTAPALADPGNAGPPLRQFQDGVPLEDIQCTYGKVLMGSPSEMPVCLATGNVERLTGMGYSLVKQYWHTGHLADNSVTSEPAVPNDFFPRIEIIVPRATPIQEVMRVDIKYDYSPYGGNEFNPDEEDYKIPGTNRTIEFNGPHIAIRHSNHIEYVGEYEKTQHLTEMDVYGEGIETYTLVPPYNGNVKHSTSLEFRVKNPMLYDEEIFMISMDNSVAQQQQRIWYSSTNNDVLAMSTMPIYAEGQSDQYPKRGIWVSTGNFVHIPQPRLEPFSLDEFNEQPDELRKDFLAFMEHIGEKDQFLKKLAYINTTGIKGSNICHFSDPDLCDGMLAKLDEIPGYVNATGSFGDNATGGSSEQPRSTNSSSMDP